MITENYDFYFEKEYRFRIGSQNGFNKISFFMIEKRMKLSIQA